MGGGLNLDGGTLTLDGRTRTPASPLQFKYWLYGQNGLSQNKLKIQLNKVKINFARFKGKLFLQ